MKKWWQDLSVSRKLYAVVGLMAILIALELFTLIFAMHTLSAVRAIVNGEGVWSKAQKNAIQSLYLYAFYQDDRYYKEFHEHLTISDGDRIGRLEILKPDLNYKKVEKAFIQGGNHPDDIRGMVYLLRRFQKVSYLDNAVVAWTAADDLMDELRKIADEIHLEVQAGGLNRTGLRKNVDRLSVINTDISKLENTFSESLGAGSRWLEKLIMTVLFLIVFSIGSTCLILIFHFVRKFNVTIKELMETTGAVGQGNFSLRATVRSHDELGQLAWSVNTMIDDLKKNIGERKEAESANQLKTLFLANMSHEIRTPLGVILGFAEALKDPKMSPADRNTYLEVIERTGKNLSRIINDILDISKVESGHLEVECAIFPLQELIEELQLLFQLQAIERGNTISFKIDPGTPIDIFTDRLRLQQILMNLIGNALRFTHQGEITLTCSYQNNLWEFRVSDTGIGLDEDQKKNLFKLFTQADQSTTRKYGGTGLGLVLSKRLAQILGGDVILKTTEVNRGSSFVASISGVQADIMTPLGRAEKNNVSESVANLQGKHILVVDDSEENQILLRFYLTKAGLEVQTAPNGAIGVEKAMRDHFDLVLMDIQMPIMDGYTATKTLRAAGFKKPIIALTANAMKEDRERSIESGCVDYLTKPVSSARLLSVINKYI